MILPDHELRRWIEQGGITGSDHYEVNPASVDLSFSGRYRRTFEGTAASDFGMWTPEQTTDNLLIQPGELVLVDTNEIVTLPNTMAGLLQLKSSMGRSGLNHLHSGWFDPGFSGTATLELHNVGPKSVFIEKGQRIIQIVLMRLTSESEQPYWQTGRYQGQKGPTVAR